MIKKISITGPESTGKSLLSKKLAEHYDTVWVPEYAREHLNSLQRTYNYNDILEIAKRQIKQEEEKISDANEYIFCDTDLIVTKIWCEVKYGKCHKWINDTLVKHKYDLHLLCDTDLPWEEDPLREHPDKREYLFNMYLKTIKQFKLPYSIIHGEGKERTQKAIDKIESFFSQSGKR